MRPALPVRLWCWNGWSDKWFAASSKARQSICVVCGTFQGPSPAHGNLADCSKRCKPFVGDDACIVPHVGPCLIPHLKLRRPLKFPSSQKAYARAFRARHMLFLLSHYRQHRTIPALRLKHRSGSCGTASASPKCSIRHPVLSALLA